MNYEIVRLWCPRLPTMGPLSISWYEMTTGSSSYKTPNPSPGLNRANPVGDPGGSRGQQSSTPRGGSLLRGICETRLTNKESLAFRAQQSPRDWRQKVVLCAFLWEEHPYFYFRFCFKPDESSNTLPPESSKSMSQLSHSQAGCQICFK